MQKITLYRYVRPDGGVSISPNAPDTAYTVLYRLIADDGYTLTDGTGNVSCVDTEDPEAWTEVEEEATIQDYQAALAELGVSL